MSKGIVDKRANVAYNYVIKLYSGNSNFKDFRSHTKKMPAMILNNGLGNAIVFAFAKGWDELLRALCEWVINNQDCPVYNKNEKSSKCVGKDSSLENNPLVRRILNSDAEEYRALTDEILAYLNWLRRFADALLKDKEE